MAKAMSRRTYKKWVPGLSGLIILPEDGKPPGRRLFFLAEIDAAGRCKVRSDLLKWAELYYRILPDLAEKEGKTAFSTPEKRLKELREKGYLRCT